MKVIIEVANEANGLGVVKRSLLRSEDFPTPRELESAAIDFIRESSAANEEILQGHLPAGTAAGVGLGAARPA